MSKWKVIEEMLSTSKIPNGDKDLLKLSCVPLGKKFKFLNFKMVCAATGALFCTSLGGPLFNRPIAQWFVTPKKYKDYKDDTGSTVNAESIPTRKKQFGLKPNEQSLLCTLPPSVVDDIQEMSTAEHDDDNDNENFLPDLIPTSTKLSCLLTSDNFNLLQDVLCELQEFNPTKWNDWTEEDLFPDLLHSAKSLQETCIVKELEIIGKLLQSYTS